MGICLANLRAGGVVVGVGALLMPIQEDASDGKPTVRVIAADLSGHSAAAPGEPIAVAFLHHSVGAQLLASSGPLTRIIHERAAFMSNAPLCLGFCRHRLRHHATRGAQDVARASPERRPDIRPESKPNGRTILGLHE